LNPADGRSHLEQAYRLYTLALAGEPELGAMNRLRENAKLDLAVLRKEKILPARLYQRFDF